jgi:hypothetical protein
MGTTGRKLGWTVAAVAAFLGGATLTTILFQDDGDGGGGSTGERAQAAATGDAGPTDTPCSRFAAAVESDEPIGDVVRRFGLPAHVAVPAEASVGTVLCTATGDDDGGGQIGGVGIVDHGTRQLWLALGPAAASWSDAEWADYLGVNGFPNAVRHDHGYTTAPEQAVAAAATGTDLWQVMDRDLPTARR